MKYIQKHSYIIRKSYSKSFLPNSFSTWLTGKPLNEKNSLLQLSWISYTLIVFTIFITSLVIVFYNTIYLHNTLITVLCWAGMLFSSRRMAAVILHQSVHERLSGNAKIDQFIGDFATLIMITQDYKTYKIDHCEIHHAPLTFATKYDPIVQFFSVFGLNLGERKNILYRNFLINIISPVFHLSFFFTRIKYNINIKRPIRSFFSIIYICLLVFIPYYFSQSFIPLFLSFIIPMIFLYQVSAFIEICSEHAWFENSVKTISNKDPYFYAEISWGRFCGSMYPSNKVKIFLWYVEQFFYHLPVRLFILVGDLPQHDFHHRHPLNFQWVKARYQREVAIGNLAPGEPEYIDIWGLHNAINYVFNIISSKNSAYIDEFNAYNQENHAYHKDYKVL